MRRRSMALIKLAYQRARRFVGRKLKLITSSLQNVKNSLNYQTDRWLLRRYSHKFLYILRVRTALRVMSEAEH